MIDVHGEKLRGADCVHSTDLQTIVDQEGRLSGVMY